MNRSRELVKLLRSFRSQDDTVHGNSISHIDIPINWLNLIDPDSVHAHLPDALAVAINGQSVQGLSNSATPQSSENGHKAVLGVDRGNSVGKSVGTAVEMELHGDFPPARLSKEGEFLPGQHAEQITGIRIWPFKRMLRQLPACPSKRRLP